MMMNTTRRALLGGVGLAGAATVVPAVAKLPLTSQVEAAFADWKATRDELNASSDDDGTDDAGHPIWARIKRSEMIMRDSRESGARVAEIRLWLSLTGDLMYDDEHAALHREDAAWLLRHARDPEFTTIMALRSIQALRGEG